MLEGLIVIISVYGISAALVHMTYRHLYRASHKHEHYILVSNDNQMHIEWVIRCLWLFSWLKGKDICITLLDQHSTDDTLKIAEKLAQHGHLDIRTIHSKQELKTMAQISDFSELCSRVVTIELNNKEDLKVT